MTVPISPPADSSGQSSGDGGNPPQQPPVAPPAGPPAGNADRGYPEGTPLEQMTVEQQSAYWKHHSRRHESTVKEFGKLGKSPEEIAAALQRLDEFDNARLSDGEKASKQAVKDAAAKAAADTEAVWRPKYQAAMLRSAASEVIKGDQLAAFLAITDPAKFAGDDGEINTDMVMGHLTALYGQALPGHNGQQHQQQQAGYQWGQHGGRPPTTNPGEGGRAEAERRKARQGIKT